MRKLTQILTLTIALFFVMPNADAQKFGYINSQELMQDIPEVKEANANIETFRTQLQRKGQDKVKALQAKYQELQVKQEKGEIAPKLLEAEAQKLKEEEQSLLVFEQESQQKIMKKSEDLLKPLMDKINAALKDVASENNYDYIFDYSTGFVLFADKSTDVSQLVKAKLGY